MIWWMVCIFLIIIIFIAWWIKRPYYHRGIERHQFDRFFKTLIEYCGDCSLLFIEHEGSERFIQYAKYVLDESNTTINFGFPDAPWSADYFKPLIKAFEASGIDYDIQSTNDKSGFVSRFIDVNIKADDVENTIKKCVQVSHVAFEVMGLTDVDKFRIYFEAEHDKEAYFSLFEQLINRAKLAKRKTKGSGLK